MNELLIGTYVAGVLLAAVFNGYMMSDHNEELTAFMVGVILLWPIALATAVGIIIETVGGSS
ncbi:hypothetical protein EXE44_04845 [Halorubrum sp. SS7]|uniref:hypothetical protein n=1 Tax=Halorubrum sp. SS7 TaxID=2518119 RepID=UPI0010F59AF5|nr:hypothetical protein [Halorubrum sp. SS7]TKX58874.1 hypothetical protein EXE44_04845 [Halorubrum sp. SS7]